MNNESQNQNQGNYSNGYNYSNPSGGQPGQPQGNPYGQANPYSQIPMEAPGHTKAIVSLILGIVSIVACSPAGIAGLIVAHMAKKEGNNEGIRTAGFVTSLIGTIILGLSIILVVIFLIYSIAIVGASGGFEDINEMINELMIL